MVFSISIVEIVIHNGTGERTKIEKDAGIGTYLKRKKACHFSNTIIWWYINSILQHWLQRPLTLLALKDFKKGKVQQNCLIKRLENILKYLCKMGQTRPLFIFVLFT